MTAEALPLGAENKGLRVRDVCSMLLARGLPSWMVEYLKLGLQSRSKAEGSKPAEVFSSSSAVSLSLTAEDLTLMGIAHPLHQRRLLRELECILTSQGKIRLEESKPPAEPKPEEPIPVEREAENRAKNGRLPSLDNFRWPDGGASTSRQKSGDQKAGAEGRGSKTDRPPTLFINHARRRWLTAVGVALDAKDEGKPVADLGLSEDHVAILSKVGSLIKPQDVFRPHREDFIPRLARKPLPSEDMTAEASKGETDADDEEDTDFGLPWEDFLQSRLHSWGPLAIVHEVLTIAKGDSLTALRDVLAEFRSHGEDLPRCLAKAALPREFDMAFPNAPPGTIAPKFIWAWVEWRLDQLETAQEKLNCLFERADQLTLVNLTTPRSARHGHGKPLTSALSSPSKPGKKKSKLARTRFVSQPIEDEKEVEEEQVMTPISQEGSSKPEHKGAKKTLQSLRAKILSEPEAGYQAAGHRFAAATEAACADAGITLGIENAALSRFRRAGREVLQHVKNKRMNSVLTNMALLKVVVTQTKVKQLRTEMGEALQQLECWPGVDSSSRKACDWRLTKLKAVSQQLFDRFLELREPTHQALRQAAAGDQVMPDAFELEQAVLDSQRELASRLLLGEEAIQAADRQGLSLRAMDMMEPPNPWEGETLQQLSPPWEATFMRALRRLAPLKKSFKNRRRVAQVDSLSPNEVRHLLASSTTLARMLEVQEHDSDQE